MHLLMTADTVGGVWTYVRELVTGLVRRGHRVSLVSFGEPPTRAQVRWMEGLDNLQYQPTTFRLEWMQDAERDLEESMWFLEKLASRIQPDVVHLNQYAYGALQTDIAKLVVAHSDVVSWWATVYKKEPRDRWMDWYRELVERGLGGADIVVAPSWWMWNTIGRYYPLWQEPQLRLRGSHPFRVVIHNGRTPSLFDPRAHKENSVLAVGRLWDQAKQVSLLLEHEHPVKVRIVGSADHPDGLLKGRAENGHGTSKIEFLGVQSEYQLRDLFARSAIYAATSCYEPFGLAPVEAALSGCALVANDIPTFRELWDDAAYYFEENDAASLAAAIRTLTENPELRREYAQRAQRRACERYGSDRMLDHYEALYRTLVRQEVAA